MTTYNFPQVEEVAYSELWGTYIPQAAGQLLECWAPALYTAQAAGLLI